MSSSIASIKFQIHEIFHLQLMSTPSCQYVDPTTNTQCPTQLPNLALFNAHYITAELAMQSPSNPASELVTVHDFPFIQTLQRLASLVHCQTHNSPIIITNRTLSFLTAAEQHPNLFSLSLALRSTIRDLQAMLRNLTRNTSHFHPRGSPQMLNDLASRLRLCRHVVEIIERTNTDREGHVQNPMVVTLSRLVTDNLEYIRANLNSTSQNPVRDQHRRVRVYEHPNGNFEFFPALAGYSSPTEGDETPPIPSRSPLRVSSSGSTSSSLSSTSSSSSGTNTSTTLSSDSSPPPSPASSQSSITSLSSEENCCICISPLHTARTTQCLTCHQPIHLDCIVQHARSQYADDYASGFVPCPLCRVPWWFDDLVAAAGGELNLERIVEDKDRWGRNADVDGQEQGRVLGEGEVLDILGPGRLRSDRRGYTYFLPADGEDGFVEEEDGDDDEEEEIFGLTLFD